MYGSGIISEENVAPARNDNTGVPAVARGLLDGNGDFGKDQLRDEPEPLIVEVEIQGPPAVAEPLPVVEPPPPPVAEPLPVVEPPPPPVAEPLPVVEPPPPPVAEPLPVVEPCTSSNPA